jgi:hypothetical protein
MSEYKDKVVFIYIREHWMKQINMRTMEIVLLFNASDRVIFVCVCVCGGGEDQEGEM